MERGTGGEAKKHGQYAIRAAITNHRSTLADFDLLVEKVIELGRELAAAV